MDEIELYIEQVSVQPQVRGQLLGNFTQLLLGQNDNVEEFEYGCGPSSAPVAMTYECRVDEDEEECQSQEGDDQSERAEDVQHDGNGVFEFIDEENNNVNVVSSFLALHEAMESEQGRYVSVDREGCDMSNNTDPKDPIEFSPVQYHSTPSLQFENVENIGGKFMVGQVFNSKANLQHAAKLYSISAHQEYIVVSSTTKLLVLRCKKTEQSQCPWKLRAMVVKGFKHCRPVLSIDGTHLYGKYKGTLMIAMGCDGNNQLFPLAFALTEDQYIGIMVVMSDVHLGWSEPYTYHRSSAVLAHLYRKLCQASLDGAIDIVGCVTLLQFITLWVSRAERIATAPPMVGAMQFHDPYMEWCIRQHSSDCY
ncbi:hypothetical protein CK203_096931 [Vitis vinifera]|uniref:Transposase MuDR plant domain-containing protein n=1 Tax=Vitis vinifera TaxID=29760 RepID=A0A438BTD9_VITVI|nr:hypothetical protein CK203_096931 [Vitis vinifera]